MGKPIAGCGDAAGNYPLNGEAPDLRELLDALRDLLAFSRAGTLHSDEGEDEAYDRAALLLERYRPAREQRS